jgi:hypothetical protein
MQRLLSIRRRWCRWIVCREPENIDSGRIMAELTTKDYQRRFASSWIIRVGITTPSKFEDGLSRFMNLTRGFGSLFVIEVLSEFLAIHFLDIDFIQGSNHQRLFIVFYRPESYRSIHMANSEEMAAWMYRKRRNIGSSMLEQVLSNDNSVLLCRQGDKETNHRVSVARTSWGPCRYEKLICL